MLYHLDCLLPREDRYLSTKYRQLSRWFSPYRLPPAYAEEIRIFLRTPGFTPAQIGLMMLWDQNHQRKALRLLEVKEMTPDDPRRDLNP